MPSPAIDKPTGLASLFGWRRLRFTLCASIVLGLMISVSFTTPRWSVLARAVAIGLFAMLAFGLFERWPRRLPPWLARWVFQVLAVAIAIPIAALAIYLSTTPADGLPFWQDRDRLSGFAMFTVFGMLVAPWAALAALVRQKDAFARDQAMAFELERSELERQALDARLHLLQAQVAPHFLFNTLANVQALVDTGSTKASAVLGSLIAYLRATVPRLHDPVTTFEHEVRLARAYLELMHMRMPDRLDFALHVDDAALPLRCPPMTLITLVENAVRHGIDPSEEGGRIDIHLQRHGDRCAVSVSDTGIGLQASGNGCGTGLATLRERLRLMFAGGAELRIAAHSPRGVRAELDLPALEPDDR